VIDGLVAALVGLALGVVTGMPLGVVNVAVADAAAAGQRRFATAIGLGGALADSVHAALAFIGIGRVVVSRPDWTHPLAIIAAAVIAAYVALSLSRRKSEVRSPKSGVPGVLAGLALTLPNPAALAAWVAVAAALWPTIAVPAAIVLAAGVGVGSALWFAALARWVTVSPRAGRAIARVGLALMLAIAAVGLVRALA
jgi:threonine/homoserine/homoserine lactone efflux protein